MRPSAPLAALVALALLAGPAAAAPPQPPPDNVVTQAHDAGVEVDWSRSKVPVEGWTTGFEVLRQQLFPVLEGGYRPIGFVAASATSFVDTTAGDTVAYRYCVRAHTVDGPQECSDPAVWVDVADCARLSGSYTFDLDTHCLYTTDPPLPIVYPTCAPIAAQVTSQGTVMPITRPTCLQMGP